MNRVKVKVPDPYQNVVGLDLTRTHRIYEMFIPLEKKSWYRNLDPAMSFCGEFSKSSWWEAGVLEQSCRECGCEKIKITYS
jgi:hypothetical protein